MTEKVQEGRVWSSIGKFSTIVTLAVGTIYLGNWYFAPSTELQAEIERGTFYLPPRYEEFAESVAEALSPENIETTLKESLDSVEPKTATSAQPTTATDESIELLTFAMSRALTEKIQVHERSAERPYMQYWHAKVRNIGDLPITQAALRMPDATVAVIDREDLTQTQDDTGPTIEIGNIAAGETVEVTAWSDNFAISMSNSSDPFLYHAEGSGSIKITNEPSLLTMLLMNKVLGIIVALFAALASFFIGMALALKGYSSKSKGP